MPGMDGFETLKVLKNNPETKHIPVIMYTSQHAHRYYEEAHTLGAAGVISKQIDRDKLYLMINRLCLNQAEEANEEKDVPTVYQEVQKNLAQALDETSNSKLVARIATLETAYEEVHEELRHLRMQLNQSQLKQEEFQQQHRATSLPQFFVVCFLALALFGATFSWFSTQKIEQSYMTMQNRLINMNELIDEIIDLLERQPDDR